MRARSCLWTATISSNLAHQSARAKPEKRAEFFALDRASGYTIYGCRAKSHPLYAHTRLAGAATRGAQVWARYTSAKHDLLEQNLRHLEDAAEMYDMLSRSRPWATIQCFDAQNNCVRLPEDIAAETMQAVRPLLVNLGKG